MPVPAANYISELDPNRPLGTEDIREGDDWFRRLIGVLQATFPTASEALPISSWAARNATSLTKSVDYTLVAADSGKPILVDASGGNRTITLPAASGVDKLYADIVKIDSSSNTVTVSGEVSGVTNPVISNQWGSLSVYSSGAAWINLYGAAGKIIGAIAQYAAPLAVAAGGLGLNASATGGNAPAHVVKQKTVGGAMEVEEINASDLPVLQGATSGTDGVRGAVPKPSAGEEDYVLYGGTPHWRPKVVVELTEADLTNGGANDLSEYEWELLTNCVEFHLQGYVRHSTTAYTRLQLKTAGSGWYTSGYFGLTGRTDVGGASNATGVVTSFVNSTAYDRIMFDYTVRKVGATLWSITVFGGDDGNIPEYGQAQIVLDGPPTHARLIRDSGTWIEGVAGGSVWTV